MAGGRRSRGERRRVPPPAAALSGGAWRARHGTRRADTGARDKGGNTPLHRAAFAGREEACRAILEWRAAEALAERELVPEAEFDRSTRLVKEVDAPDMVGWTPLHFAARQGSAAVVRCLLAYEADVGGVNRFKDTPLHEACRAGHAQCAYELVLAGANTAAVNSKGKTPAMLTGDSAVLAALEGVAPPEPMKEKPVVAVERTPEPLGDVPLGPRPQDDDEQAGVFGLREADKPKAEVGRSRAEFLATLGAGDDGDDLDGPAGDFDELD